MSLVQWCEREFHPYEPYNSISNAAFIAVYFAAPKRNALIAAVGLGSFYFHITGSYLGEMLDELSMSLLAYQYYTVIARSHNRAYLAWLSMVWLLYIRYKLYAIFTAFFTCQILLPLGTLIVQPRKSAMRKKYLAISAAYMVTAFSCWGYERYLQATGQCPSDTGEFTYYLHSYWHVGAAMAHYYFMEASIQ
jgi:hypothetical protein